jgi:hypothetical protein
MTAFWLIYAAPSMTFETLDVAFHKPQMCPQLQQPAKQIRTIKI